MAAKHNPSWRAFHAARQRCTNPNTHNFHHYGGRGIRMLWTSFRDFISDMGMRPTSAHSIDRIDVNGDYCASNCRWATDDEQRRNKRPYHQQQRRRYPYSPNRYIVKDGNSYLVMIRMLSRGPVDYIGSYPTLSEAQAVRDICVYERDVYANLGLTYVKPQ